MVLNFFRHFGVASFLAKQSGKSKAPSTNSRHSLSASGEDEIDPSRNAEPMLLFRKKLFAAGRSQFVVSGFAIVIRNAPFGFDPALRLQSIERGIKRALLNA